MKQLLFAIFFLILSCGQSFAAGNIVDRGASSTEVTAQERDDIWLSPSNLPGLISGMTDTTLANEDYLLFWDYSDNSTLKKVDAAEIIGGGGGSIIVKEDNVTVDATVDTLDLFGDDFDVTEDPEDETNIVIASGAMDDEYVELGDAFVGEVTGNYTTTVIADSVTVTGWALGASTATTPAGDDNDTSLATTLWCETTQNYLKTSEVTNTALDDIGDPELLQSIRQKILEQC
jgi:hypothetical protein